jgi:hypothetical protein
MGLAGFLEEHLRFGELDAGVEGVWLWARASAVRRCCGGTPGTRGVALSREP